MSSQIGLPRLTISPKQVFGGLRMARVLVVDDSWLTRQVVGKILKKEKHEYMEAGNGIEALALLEKGIEPDCTIVDLLMPEMDGIELLKTLREK